MIYFLKNKHVISICCFQNNEIWCANLFYVFQKKNMVFWVMTSPNTIHGKLIQLNSKVAGTINDQSKNISLIQGIQYSGYITKIAHNLENLAIKSYQKRFPISQVKYTQIWEISINKLKMTDNSNYFGNKTTWVR